MLTFLSALSQLYQVAEHLTPDGFQQEVFRVCKQLLYFDGGIFGSGHAIVTPRTGLHISKAIVHGREPALLQDYIEVSANDPILRMLANGMAIPFHCECIPFYRERRLLSMFNFARKHAINQILAFGDSPSRLGAMRWICLYRRSANAFDNEDTALLHAMWPHLTRAVRINLRYTLDRASHDKTERAMALLDPLGTIEVADPLFIGLLIEEWPSENGSRLPKTVWDSLLRKGVFRGRRLSLSMSIQPDHMVCKAQRLMMHEPLGMLEKTVAMLFVDGHDYKSIARRLGTSPNTVRNQISQIYRKLGIHDKLSLASMIRSHQEAPADVQVSGLAGADIQQSPSADIPPAANVEQHIRFRRF